MIEFAIPQEDRAAILAGLLYKSEFITDLYFIQNRDGVLLMVSECPALDYASYFYEYKSNIDYGIGSMPVNDFRLTDFIKITEVTDFTKNRIKELSMFEPATKPVCDFNHDGITKDIIYIINHTYASHEHKNFLEMSLKAERLSNLVMLDLSSNKMFTTNGQILKGWNLDIKHNSIIDGAFTDIVLPLWLVKNFMTTPYQLVVHKYKDDRLIVQIVKENYMFARNIPIESYPAWKKLFEVTAANATSLHIKPALLSAMINALPKDPEVDLESSSDYKSYHALRFDMQNKIMRVDTDNPTIKKSIYRLDKYVTVDNCKDIIYFNLDYFRLFLISSDTKEDFELIFTGSKSQVILNGTYEFSAFMPCMLNKYYVKGTTEHGEQH